MNRKKKFFALICAYPILQLHATPYIAFRSQGVNSARQLVGWSDYIYKPYCDKFYTTLAITPSYTRSFRSDDITRCLFEDSLQQNNVLKISGSQVANRGSNDLLADYFYLPTDYQSTVSFKPRIDNIILDFSCYFGLDEWYPGLYFLLTAPFVHTRWHLNIEETIENRGGNTNPEGYFTPAPLARGRLLESFSAYAQGISIDPIVQMVNQQRFTVTMQPLKNALMNQTATIKSRFADWCASFGWNFINTDWYRAGIFVQGAAPLGNRPEGEFLFEPIAGNGHHWEFGGGFNGQCMVWQNHAETACIDFIGSLIITHLFNARQRRTFDLIRSKNLSRYMIAQRFDTPQEITIGGMSIPVLSGDGLTPNLQFFSEFAPVANLTNIRVDVTAPVQTDIVLMAHFKYHQWSFDIGYNFWARACEKLQQQGLSLLELDTCWGLKGDAQVYGFMSANSGTLQTNDAVALSATENSATIHAGLNNGNQVNAEIDNALPAFANGGGGPQPLNNRTTAGAQQINTSIDPIILTVQDVNFDASLTHGMSSKIFAHLNYGWEECPWVPFVGIGGEAEFAHGKQKRDNCMRCALSQWSVWIKGGIAIE